MESPRTVGNSKFWPPTTATEEDLVARFETSLYFNEDVRDELVEPKVDVIRFCGPGLDIEEVRRRAKNVSELYIAELEKAGDDLVDDDLEYVTLKDRRFIWSGTFPIEEEDEDGQQVEFLEKNEDENSLQVVKENEDDSGAQIEVVEPRKHDFEDNSFDKKEHIVAELIDTELKYIASLKYAVDNYQNYLKRRMSNVSFIFSNVEDIINYSIVFLEALTEYQSDYHGIGWVFLNQEKLFNLYPYYGSHKQRSNDLLIEHKDIVMERELQIKDRLGLKSHLLKPIQRLTKYKLLLESLQKSLRKSGESSDYLDRAILLIAKYLTKTNDAVLLASIKDNPYSCSKCGDLIFYDDYKLLQPSRMDIVLFLFSKMIIFAKRDACTKSFFYKDRIHLENLYRSIDEDKFTITLQNYRRLGVQFVIKAKDYESLHRCSGKIDELLMIQLKKKRTEIRKLYEEDISDEEMIKGDEIQVKSKSRTPVPTPRTKIIHRGTTIGGGDNRNTPLVKNTQKPEESRDQLDTAPPITERIFQDLSQAFKSKVDKFRRSSIPKKSDESLATASTSTAKAKSKKKKQKAGMYTNTKYMGYYMSALR
ncbi:PREDICTED: triple functional domain protein-like [Nicrophorus vespilloides]|uniref:Triple functional domain protein-like n=1 Tax=Nicrophorus vespilloides TaxID=110193 RepID=A0ABM1MBT6_NICVS|nr:PREDICTED: triple functional domain protein-like [Nicrophorus vespilloides]